jgi:Right handed beta helix region
VAVFRAGTFRGLSMPLAGAFLLAFSVVPAAPAVARTLVVGPDQKLTSPQAAARAARDGDTIVIEPVDGGYYSCAVWNASRLTIEGEGGGAVITDTTCEGKAIFVTVGSDITIRNLTFARARVPDRNGAGIRAEGANLRVEHSKFIDNQSGILAASSPKSTIGIFDSQFIDNGACTAARCADAVNTDTLAVLDIERCQFQGTRLGDHILSRAQLTMLIGDKIADGPTGTSGYLVDLPMGGSLVMRDNDLEKGPHSSNPDIAVKVMAGFGAHRVGNLIFVDNRLRADGKARLVFVSNWSGTRAQMNGNTFQGSVTPVSSDGYRWFAAKSFVHYSIDSAKAVARGIKRLL